MPLSINVGLSRKASKDYQSTGVSINVTAELDQSLLARPQHLQQQIDALYRHARLALDRQAQAPAAVPSAAKTASRIAASNGPSANGNNTAMTASQRRAINAIATRLSIDPRQESRDIIGQELDDLTLRQASALIDHLKGLDPAVAPRGRSAR